VDAAGELAKLGSCIIYERRGFPRSSVPGPFERTDLTDHVEDAAALLAAQTSSPAAVIGRSTGGLVALALAHRHPERVRALVLLEPAVFTLDPRATVWAEQLRRKVLRAASENPASAAEAVIREALGNSTWEALPADLRELFTAASPAVVAEIKGKGLDLSAEPVEFSAVELTGIDQPTSIVSSEESPDILRRINDHLAVLLPHTQQVLVSGGHLIHPAHPAVLNFVKQVLGSPAAPNAD